MAIHRPCGAVKEKEHDNFDNEDCIFRYNVGFSNQLNGQSINIQGGESPHMMFCGVWKRNYAQMQMQYKNM